MISEEDMLATFNGSKPSILPTRMLDPYKGGNMIVSSKISS